MSLFATLLLSMTFAHAEPAAEPAESAQHDRFAATEAFRGASRAKRLELREVRWHSNLEARSRRELGLGVAAIGVGTVGTGVFVAGMLGAGPAAKGCGEYDIGCLLVPTVSMVSVGGAMMAALPAGVVFTIKGARGQREARLRREFGFTPVMGQEGGGVQLQGSF